jgi:RHS repeat-associated protein
MPRWWVSEPYENLCISDTPLSYTMSSGQEMAFTFNYRQRYQLPALDEVPGFLCGAYPRSAYDQYVTVNPCGMTNAVWGNNWTLNIMFWDAYWESLGTFLQQFYPVYRDSYEAYVFRPEGDLQYFYNLGSGNASLQDARSQVQLQPVSTVGYPVVGWPTEDANGYFWGSPNCGFRLLYPDGSQDVFGVTYYVSGYLDSENSTAEALLSARIDPQGRATQLGYEYFYNSDGSISGFRLRYVVDPDGRTNTLLYVGNSPTNPWAPDPWALTEVDDPYGRKAEFGSDSNSGVLTSITDAAGLTSSFQYLGDGSGWITNLTTPYGSTSFSFYQVTDPTVTNGFQQRATYVSEPEGAQQFFLYEHINSLVASNLTSPTNIGQSFDDGTPKSNLTPHYALGYRNTFHWGRRQFDALSGGVKTSLAAGNLAGAISSLSLPDYTKADLKHWLLSGADQLSITEALSSEQDPSPDAAGQNAGWRTWYNYPDKPSPELLGDDPQISCIARLLPDGSSQYTTYNFYPIGWPYGGGLVSDNESSYSLPDGTVGVLTNWFGYAGNGIDLTSVSNSAGQFWNIGYNGVHQATSVTNALNQVTTLGWDSLTTNLSQVSLPSGQTITLTYYYPVHPPYVVLGNTNSLLQSISLQPQGLNIQITDYTNGLPRVVTTSGTRLSGSLTVTNFWDGLNRLTGTAFPDGTTTSNSYDRLYVAAAKDRRGYWTSYGYDSLEHLVSITDARTNTTQLNWCDCGSLSSITDPLNNTNFFNYNNQGLLTNILFADNSSVTYTLDSIGRVTGAADGQGTLSFGYNNQGLVTVVSNAYGAVERVLYDAINRPIQVTDANNITVTNQFDLLNRLTSRFWPDGIGEGFGWATNGLVAYTNRDQKVTLCARDTAGRLTAVTNANQEVTQLGYDALNAVTSLLDGRTSQTLWNYNQYGWLMSKLNALGQQVLAYTRDPNGQITNRWTPQFGNTGYAYDEVGNLKAVNYPLSSINYAYDALNRLQTMVDNSGTNTFGYTAAGQLQSVDGPWASDTVSNSYSHQLRQTLTLAQPSGGNWQQTYGYDSAWRLQSLSSPAGGFGYGYNVGQRVSPASLVRNLTLPNAASITNHFDSLARLDYTALVNYWGHVLDGYSYGMDPLGLRTNITRNLGLTNSSVTVGYDSIGQLTSWQAREDLAGPLRLHEQLGWVYDAAGNLLYRTNGGLIQTFTTDPVNQLTNVARNSTMTLSGAMPAPAASVTVDGQAAQTYGDFTFAMTNVSLSEGNNTFSIAAHSVTGTNSTNNLTLNLPTSVTLLYDSNGNLTNDGTRVFGYDAENQLTNVAIAGQWRSDFVYDGLNRRRVERDFAWQGAWVCTNEVHYIYDGRLLIQERNTNGNPPVTYTRGPDFSSGLQGAGGIGGLIARTDGNGSTFYHADGAGNITSLMDGQQNVAARYMYGPFGRLVGQWGPMASANVMQFSSMPRHFNSGLSLYPFRGYDPTLQRWLTQDPLGEISDINLYRAMANNPLSVVDRSGRDNMYNMGAGNNAPVNIVLTLTPIMQPTPPVLSAQGSSVVRQPEEVPTGRYLMSSQYGGDDPLIQYALWGGATLASLYGPELLAAKGLPWLNKLAKCKATTGGIGPVLKGQAGVDRAIAQIEAEGGQVLGKEITLDAGGVRTRPDLFVQNADGSYSFVEVKTGPNAALTPNQTIGFPAIEAGGAVPAGANAAETGVLTPGVPRGPTPVRVITYP